MKNSNFIIILILIFIFIVNIEGVFPSPIPKPPVVTTSDLLLGEGMVVMSIKDLNIDSLSLTDPSSCACKGTKKIKSGDGLSEFPCPCGDNCKCAKPGGMAPIVPQPLIFAQVPEQEVIYKEIEILPYQILQFTAKWCGPCVSFNNDKQGFVSLDKQGWYKRGLIKKIDVDEYPEIFERYKVENSIPQFVMIVNGKVVDSIVGRPTTDSKTTAAYKVSAMFMKYYGKR